MTEDQERELWGEPLPEDLAHPHGAWPTSAVVGVITAGLLGTITLILAGYGTAYVNGWIR